MKYTYIYILQDPNTLLIRYVGKTNDPYKRYLGHLTEKYKSLKTNWIKSLLKEQNVPILQIVDCVEENEWEYWESYWITVFLNIGHPLCNHTIGGVGVKYIDNNHKNECLKQRRAPSYSEEHRCFLREQIKKIQCSKDPAIRKKISDSLKGVKHTEKRKANLQKAKLKKSKLSESMIIEIYLLCKNKTYLQREIAKMYNISQPFVNNISQKKRYSHILELL